MWHGSGMGGCIGALPWRKQVMLFWVKRTRNIIDSRFVGGMVLQDLRKLYVNTFTVLLINVV